MLRVQLLISHHFEFCGLEWIKIMKKLYKFPGDATSAIQIETVTARILDRIRNELSFTWRFYHC